MVCAEVTLCKFQSLEHRVIFTTAFLNAALKPPYHGDAQEITWGEPTISAPNIAAQVNPEEANQSAQLSQEINKQTQEINLLSLVSEAWGNWLFHNR